MRIHMVKQGDTLYGLGEKYRTSVEQIIALNPHIADPNRIELGTKVKIPSAPKPVEPPASEIAYKHIVQQGDTLWKLGKAWDVPLQAMLQANPHLKNPNVLMTGDIVFIPKLGAEPHTPQPVPQPELPEEAAAPAEPAAPAPVEPAVEPPVNQPAQPEPTPLPAAPAAPVVPAPAAEEPAVISGPAPGEVGLPSGPLCPPPLSAEGGDLGLSQPYLQAEHPFKQIEITATEVFAYPAQPDGAYDPAAGMPAFPPAFPWEATASYGSSQHGAGPLMPYGMPSAAAAAQGCGCGGPVSGELGADAWQGYPAAAFPPHMLPGAVPQDGQPPFPTGPAGAPGPFELHPGPCFPVGGEYAPPMGDPFGGPAGFPAGGPAGFPMGGPTGFPVGGPAGFPMGGPAGFPVGGPAGFPMGGPAGFSMGGPADFPMGGPADFPMGGPAGFSAGGPTGFPMGGPAGFPVGGPTGFPMGGPAGFPMGGPAGGPMGFPPFGAQPPFGFPQPGFPGAEAAVSGTPLLSPQVKTHQLPVEAEEEKVELDIRPSRGAGKASGKAGGSARRAKSASSASAALQALAGKRSHRPEKTVKQNGPWINV